MKKIFKIQIGLMMLAGVAASCSDEMTFSPGGLGEENGSRSKATLGLDFNVNQPGFRTRANSEDVKTLWIGAYDIQTGERVGFKFHDDVKTGKAIVQVVYFDSHPDVVIVGVANSKGYKSTNSNGEEVDLDDLLKDASTWELFRNINVKFDDALNPGNLMMGFAAKEAKNNPIMEVGGENSTKTVIINNNGIDNTGNYRIKLFTSDDITGGDNFNADIIKEIQNPIQLVPVVSTVKVVVEPENGVEISNISYKVGNLPNEIYLAERAMYTEEVKTYTTFVEKSPNYADTKMKKNNEITALPNYFPLTSPENDEWVKADGKEFSFKQAENKHWSANFKNIGSNDYFSRQKYYDDHAPGDLMENIKILQNLCPNYFTEYNNFASYFVVKMNVKDKDGASAVVEYTVHAGNANDQYGNPSSEPRDFSCFRNMNYTYTLKVGGIESLKVNVDTERPHNDGIAGTIWDVNGTKAPIGTVITGNVERENSVYRLYVGPGYFTDNTARDFISDEETARSLSYNWPEILANASIEDLKDYIKWEIDDNGDFKYTLLKEREEKEEYPDNYLIALYYYNSSESYEDKDGCTVQATMNQVIYKPEQLVKEKLPDPNFVKSYTYPDFITKEVVITVPEIEGVDANAYEYVLTINGKKSDIEYTKGSGSTEGSFVIPINDLNPAVSESVENKFSVYAKAISVREYWDSDPVEGTIKLTQPEWWFNDNNWKQVYETWTWIDNKSYYKLPGGPNVPPSTYNLLTLNNPGDKDVRGYADYLHAENSGGDSAWYLSFRIYRDCRVVLNAGTSDESTGKILNVEGGNSDIQTIDIPGKLAYLPAVNVKDLNQGTEIRVYNTGGKVIFKRLQLKNYNLVENKD